MAGSLLVAFVLFLPAGIFVLGSGDRSPWYLLLLLPVGALVWGLGALIPKRWVARLHARLSELERKSLKVAEVRGVPIFFHWTLAVLLLALLPAVAAWPRGVLAMAASHVLVVLLHEAGHAVAARHEGCEVDSILVGVVHGVTRFSIPFRRRSAVLIAWGGVVAQAAVGVPASVAWYLTEVNGISVTEAALLFLGPLNLLIASINLAPLPGLDGKEAWAFRRLRLRRQPSNVLEPRRWNR